ncbi:MAG: hemoglobin [Candidatus Azotimanducaceae bacterium]|jgi:hemoglobin
MPTYGKGDASFLAAGGEQGIQRLVEAFYQAMCDEPQARLIRAMHPDDLTISVDKLARFLCGWTGGPRRYAEKYGGIAIPPAHAHLPIGEAEKDAWLLCMQRALQSQDYAADFKDYLLLQLAVPAGRIVVMQAHQRRTPGP